jgi:hypothetical protein
LTLPSRNLRVVSSGSMMPFFAPISTREVQVEKDLFLVNALSVALILSPFLHGLKTKTQIQGFHHWKLLLRKAKAVSVIHRIFKIKIRIPKTVRFLRRKHDCKYHLICKNYAKSSYTCTHSGGRYCGVFRGLT